MIQRKETFKVIDDIGLHARPAMEISNRANCYQSDISIIHNGREAKLKSILGPMALGIGTGEEITIIAVGNDADIVMNELTILFEKLNFAK